MEGQSEQQMLDNLDLVVEKAARLQDSRYTTREGIINSSSWLSYIYQMSASSQYEFPITAELTQTLLHYIGLKYKEISYCGETLSIDIYDESENSVINGFMLPGKRATDRLDKAVILVYNDLSFGDEPSKQEEDKDSDPILQGELAAQKIYREKILNLYNKVRHLTDAIGEDILNVNDLVVKIIEHYDKRYEWKIVKKAR